MLTFTDGCSDTCFIDYRPEVPASATVRLGNSSGKITVAGVAAADLTSDSGAVEADRVAGPLKIRTSSGAITARGLTGPSADIRSGSRDTRLASTQAPTPVAAETSSALA